MMPPHRRIAVSLLLASLAMPLLPGARTVFAGSKIRIIGDKSPDSPASPAPSPPPSKGSTTIRIVSDQQAPGQQQAGDQQPPSPQSRAAASAPDAGKAVSVTVPAETASQPAALKTAEERKAIEKAEQELQTKLKLEEERTAAEKAEQARRAKLKEAQDKAAAELARQTALRLEQKLLADRKAEELRRASEKAEQDRINALKAEEETLAAARKALLQKLEPGASAVQQNKPGTSGSMDVSPSAAETISVNRVVQEQGSGNGTSQKPASIWELYLAAKTHDPALSRSEARVTGSRADSDVVFSGLLPHLDSSAGMKQISQTLTNYNTTGDVQNNYSALNYNVTARMTLLHVPTLYSLSAAAAALKGEEAGVAAARQNLIVKCADAYFNLLKAQTDRQIALGEINRLRQVLDQAQAFLKAGTGDIIAVYEAQSRLDGANADLTKSESALRLAEQKLSTLAGMPVSNVINYLPQQPAAPDPDNLEWWVATMEKEQPQIRQAREGLNQTAEQRKAVKSEYLPILQASGGYDVNRGTAALPNAEVRQWFAGISLSLPLYSGGETSAKVRRAVATEEERRHMLDESMDQYRESVKQAYFNLRYNISLIKALDQKQTSAEIQLAAVKKGRKIGTRNAIDVLNAEQAYSMALRDHRYALYDNIIRVIQLKSAAGILTEADLTALAQIEAPEPDNGLNMIISKVDPR